MQLSIQQMPLTLRFSGTVAMDFVIPVAWGAFLYDLNIVTAAKLKTTQGCEVSPLPEPERLGGLQKIKVPRWRLVSDRRAFELVLSFV